MGAEASVVVEVVVGTLWVVVVVVVVELVVVVEEEVELEVSMNLAGATVGV